MTTLAENNHYAVGFTPERELAAAPSSNRLSVLETIPLTVGLPDKGGVRPMLDQVEHWASELLEPATRDNQRMRLLARMIAAQRARLALRETQREQVLLAGEFMAALVLDKIVQGDARRLAALIREHRHECLGETRTVRVSVVAAKDRPQVNILAGAAR